MVIEKINTDCGSYVEAHAALAATVADQVCDHYGNHTAAFRRIALATAMDKVAEHLLNHPTHGPAYRAELAS